MDFLNGIINYLTASPTRFIKKVFFVIMVLITIGLIDRTFNFSYYNNLDHKLEKFQKINTILNQSHLTTNERMHLERLKTEVLNRKNLFEFKLSKFNLFTFFESNDIRNPYIHFVSSSWFFLLIMLILPFIGVIRKKNGLDKKIDLEAILISLVLLEPLLFFLAWVSAFILAQIPIILGITWLNYLLNIIIVMVVVAIYNKMNDKISLK